MVYLQKMNELYFNCIGIGDEGFSAICENLKMIPNLKKIDFGRI